MSDKWGGMGQAAQTPTALFFLFMLTQASGRALRQGKEASDDIMERSPSAREGVKLKSYAAMWELRL